MGIKYCLSTLKSSMKLLSNISRQVTKLNEDRILSFNTLCSNDLDLISKLEKFPSTRTSQMALDTLLADLAATILLVQKYQLVSAGIPLFYEGIDLYTPTPDDQEIVAVMDFMNNVANTTGLVPIMADTGRDEEVSDAEILSTYRAISCQSFTAFEIAVHRAVDTVADRVWEMAVDLDALDRIKETIIEIKQEPDLGEIHYIEDREEGSVIQFEEESVIQFEEESVIQIKDEDDEDEDLYD